MARAILCRRIILAVSKDTLERKQIEVEKLRPYIIAVVIVLGLAIISTFIAGLARPGSCSSIYQQQNYNCVEQMAYATSNAQMCSTLPSYYSSRCYASIGEHTNNETVCNMSSDPNVSAQCTVFVANATMNPSLCNNIQSGYIASCIDSIALQEQEPGLCAQIFNASGREICLNAIYYNDAISKSNSSYCSLMTSNNNLSVTYQTLSLASTYAKYNYINITQTLDYAVFSNLTIGASDICYISLAYVSKNSSYCSSTSNQTSVLCNISASHFSNLPQNKTNANSTVNYTTFLNSCTLTQSFSQCNDTINYMTAIEEKNITKCGTLSTSYAYQCYYGIAQEYNSTSYCSYIKNATLNNECVLSISSGYLNNANNSVG